MSDREFDKEMENLRTAVDGVNDLPEEILDDPRVLNWISRQVSQC